MSKAQNWHIRRSQEHQAEIARSNWTYNLGRSLASAGYHALLDRAEQILK